MAQSLTASENPLSIPEKEAGIQMSQAPEYHNPAPKKLTPQSPNELKRGLASALQDMLTGLRENAPT
jgi:hypothetical protein